MAKKYYIWRPALYTYIIIKYDVRDHHSWQWQWIRPQQQWIWIKQHQIQLHWISYMFALFFYLSPNVFIRACKITASSSLSFCEKQQRLSFIVKDSEKVLETLRAPFTFWPKNIALGEGRKGKWERSLNLQRIRLIQLKLEKSSVEWRKIPDLMAKEKIAINKLW